jgi:hypothetical protein
MHTQLTCGLLRHGTLARCRGHYIVASEQERRREAAPHLLGDLRQQAIYEIANELRQLLVPQAIGNLQALR